MDFLLFLGVNAALFIRPAELLPSLANWPIYNAIIVLNLVVAAPAVISRLSQHRLVRSPSTMCMLGLLMAIGLSHVARFDLESATANTIEFAKIVAYFLLLLSVVNTTQRFRWFLCAMIAFIATSTGIALLDYHGIIDMPNVRQVKEHYVVLSPTGEWREEVIPRLGATGIIGDPNDLALVIAGALTISAGYVMYHRFTIWTLLLLPIQGLLGYGLALTNSRGGLVALGCSSLALFYSRYGFKKALWLWIPTAMLGAALFAGRQTDFSSGLSGGGSGQERAGLWSDWLQEGLRHPVFGVGARHGVESINGRAAHNSYIESFCELGIVGSVFFVGLLCVSIIGVHRLGIQRHLIADKNLADLQPAIFAMLISYAVSMLALSRCYDVTTYLFAGLAASYDELATNSIPIYPLRMEPVLAMRMVQATVGVLAGCYCLMQIAR
jgi:hypothetical protein